MANSHSRFLWYELMTSGAEAARAFYADVMGWRAKDASVPGLAYTLFTAREASVAGMMQLPEEAREMGVRPTWTGYVGVDDVDATTHRVKQLGGSVYVPPRNISNVSRFSVIADPQMATLALFKWLNAHQDQPIEPGTPGRVGWHELLAADWEQAWAFYAGLFDWQKALAVTGKRDTYQLFSVGGETIGGMFTKPATVAAPFWLYYFSTSDIDAAAKRVTAVGGEILNGPTEAPSGSWVIQCTDPQGAIFGLVGKRSYRKFVVTTSGQSWWQTKPEPAA